MQQCCLYLLIGSFFRQAQLLCHGNSFCHTWHPGSSRHKGMACAAGFGVHPGGMCLQFDHMHLAYQGVKGCPACNTQALITPALIRSFLCKLQLAKLTASLSRLGHVIGKGGKVGGGEGIGSDCHGGRWAAVSDCSHRACSLTHL